jgi:hypothetical protein
MMLCPERGPDTRRRELITLLGGAVVVLPLAARAQQVKVRRIGVLLVGNEEADSFRKELREIERARSLL